MYVCIFVYWILKNMYVSNFEYDKHWYNENMYVSSTSPHCAREGYINVDVPHVRESVPARVFPTSL